MVSKVKLVLSFIALCALSFPIKAYGDVIPDPEEIEVERLFGVSLEENIDKLKALFDTTHSAAVELVRNAADKSNDFIDKLAAELGPGIAKSILNYGKGLSGLKLEKDDSNTATNVCFVDAAVSKLDTLPNDVGRQIQICKKNVAKHISEYIDKTQTHFEEASTETAELGKEGLRCLKNINLLCVGKVSVKIAAAIFKIPNQITKQASQTVTLINRLQERGAVCLTKAIERTEKKAASYINQVEDCLKKHNVNLPVLTN